MRFQRERSRAGDGGLHAADALAVGKNVNGHGIRAGNQMPDGRNAVIGLPRSERNDFDFRELEPAAQPEGKRGRDIAPGLHGRSARTEGVINVHASGSGATQEQKSANYREH